MGFNFFTDSIKASLNKTGIQPDKKNTTLAEQMFGAKSLTGINGSNSSTPIFNGISTTNTTTQLGPTKEKAEELQTTQKAEEAKADYFDKTHQLSNNLTDQERQQAMDYINSIVSSGKKIDTDSVEFRYLPPATQKFIHAQLEYLTGVNTEKIPYGQKQEVNLKPEFSAA